jgi:hypothetical protein
MNFLITFKDQNIFIILLSGRTLSNLNLQPKIYEKGALDQNKDDFCSLSVYKLL